VGYVDVSRRKNRKEQASGPRGVTHLWHNPSFLIVAGLGLLVPAWWFDGWLVQDPGYLPLVPSAVLVCCGIWQLRRGSPRTPVPKHGGEKQLLLAIRDLGGLTAVEAALETSLTVDEAEEMLSRLANRGHLHVQSRDGTLAYALPEKSGLQ
jgi:hypothetical protein